MIEYNPEKHLKIPPGKNWFTMSYADYKVWESMNTDERIEYCKLSQREMKHFLSNKRKEWVKNRNHALKERLDQDLKKSHEKTEAIVSQPIYDIPDNIICPRCGKSNCKVSRKGFSKGKAAVGFMFFGILGTTVGNIGKNNLVIDCFSCGYQWTPPIKKDALSPEK